MSENTVFRFYRGDDFSLRFDVTDAQGLASDITGWDLEVTLKQNPLADASTAIFHEASLVITPVDASMGIFYLQVPNAITATMVGSAYFLNILRTFNDVKTTLMNEQVSVVPASQATSKRLDQTVRVQLDQPDTSLVLSAQAIPAETLTYLNGVRSDVEADRAEVAVNTGTASTKAAEAAASASDSAASASASETSKTTAGAYAVSASSSATASSASAGAAAVSETNADISEDLAFRWANELEDVVVANLEYSAKHHRIKIEGQLTAHELAADPHAQYVQKIVGKGLSTENYTTAEQTKVAAIEAGAQVNTVTSVDGFTGAVDLSGNYEQKRKNNLSATTNPTVNDDSVIGYEPLSRWINVNTAEIWLCVDDTVGAANWQQATLTVNDLGSAALADVGTGASQLPRNSDLGSASLNATADFEAANAVSDHEASLDPHTQYKTYADTVAEAAAFEAALIFGG